MRVGSRAGRGLKSVAGKGRVGDCGKGRAGLVSPKAAVQPLELLLPILQSLEASNQKPLVQCDVMTM